MGKFLAFVLILVTGCATSVGQRLEKVQTGMDKTQVLDLAGNPKRVVRQDGRDLWTFVYYVGDKRFEREVRFNEGHVSDILTPREVSASAQADMVTQDYENLVKEAEEAKKAKKP